MNKTKCFVYKGKLKNTNKVVTREYKVIKYRYNGTPLIVEFDYPIGDAYFENDGIKFKSSSIKFNQQNGKVLN